MSDAHDDIEGNSSFTSEVGKTAALIVALAVLTLFALSIYDLIWPIKE